MYIDFNNPAELSKLKSRLLGLAVGETFEGVKQRDGNNYPFILPMVDAMTAFVPLSRSLVVGAAAMLGLAACSQRVPEAAEIFGTHLSKEADEFLTASNTEFNQKQQAFEERWLDDYEHYDVDLEQGVLRLSRGAKPPIVFDVEAVGSFSSTDNSWEWAWNNPNVKKSLAVPRDALKGVGEKYDLKYLLSGVVPVPDKQFPYYLSGIAMKVRGAMGVFEATYEDLRIYLLLRNPREGDS